MSHNSLFATKKTAKKTPDKRKGGARASKNPRERLTQGNLANFIKGKTKTKETIEGASQKDFLRCLTHPD